MTARVRYRPALQHYKTTERAIRVLACVGDELIRTRVIAERTGISQQLAFKIVSRLVRAGLLTSIRGTNGGVCLARPITQITVAEVVEAVAPGRSCGDGLESVPAFMEALEAFVHVLDGYTVADAVEAPDRAGPRAGKSKPARKPRAKPKPPHARTAPPRARPTA